jgi:peptidoglycan hydrolase CwlO-like protein
MTDFTAPENYIPHLKKTVADLHEQLGGQQRMLEHEHARCVSLERINGQLVASAQVERDRFLQEVARLQIAAREAGANAATFERAYNEAVAERDAAIATAEHIGRERDALRAAGENTAELLEEMYDSWPMNGPSLVVVRNALDALRAALGGGK